MAKPKLRYVPNSQLPKAEPLQPGRRIQPSDQGRQAALTAAVDRTLAPGAPLGHDVAMSRLLAPGPGVSGYGFLATLAGKDLAAAMPGTQDWATGGRPAWTTQRGCASTSRRSSAGSPAPLAGVHKKRRPHS